MGEHLRPLGRQSRIWIPGFLDDYLPGRGRQCAVVSKTVPIDLDVLLCRLEKLVHPTIDCGIDRETLSRHRENAYRPPARLATACCSTSHD